MVKNRHLAKSINDAAWSMFREWLEYFGYKYKKVTVAVPPHNTSQNCSNCGATVKKSLSTRTHKCKCGCVLDRDQNAALNILSLGLTCGRAYRISSYSLTAWLALRGEDTALLAGDNLSTKVISVN
jgi:putative transposase